MISILIPVLGRPHNAAPLVENIHDTTDAEHEILFLCSRGDTPQIEACFKTKARTVVMEYPAGSGDFGRKINAGFHATANVQPPDGEWVFMCADDVRFEPKWDYHALRAAKDTFHVIGTNDLANAQVQRGLFGTHCLIRRRYITEQGGTADFYPGDVLWEGYDHNFVDRELCHVAQQRGVFAFARHSRVRHYHPLWRTAPQDDTYRKALKNFRADQALFLSRAHLWDYVGLSGPERTLAA